MKYFLIMFVILSRVHMLTVPSMGLIFLVSWSKMDGMILFKLNFKDNSEGAILLQKEPL